MKQEHKLYVAIGAMLALGIAVYVVMGERDKAAEAQSGQAAEELPVVKVAPEEAAKITKFVLANKDKGTVTLEKKGDEWMISKPFTAKANQKNVQSLIDNLDKLELTATIGSDPAIHEKHELTDGKAVQVQAFKGDEKVLDLYFGKSGSRGQVARRGGDGVEPTVYVIKGYTAFTWAREARNWRHNEILNFESGNVIAAEVENENGKFSFTKAEDAWTAKHYARDKEGALAEKPKDIDRFDDQSVTRFIDAFKALKATNFAEDKDDTGVGEAVKTGGVVRITMKDEDKPKYVILVGNAQEGSNRFLKVDGDDTVYVVTNFASDWAMAKADKFKKPEEKKKDDEGDEDDKDDKDAKDAKDAKGKDAEKKDAKGKDAKGKDAKGKDAKDAPKPPKKEAPKPKPAEGK